MRRLPEEKRRAMFAVYAFCREVDDIADEPGAIADKLRDLGAWRDEIERLYAGTPTFIVTRGLVRPISLFALRKEDFLAVIEGMEMDAAVTLRFGNMDELRRYCDCVACAVGRLSNRVFGIGEEMGNRVAGALGEALQLTNILRDVHEDAERDRLYLPADLLARHEISDGALPAVLDHPNLALACAELAEMTERRFAEADTLLATCDRRQMRPAVMMMAVYRRVLRRLARRGWRRLAEPVTLSKLEKIWILIRHGMV
jgi:phytoene synthase